MPRARSLPLSFSILNSNLQFAILRNRKCWTNCDFYCKLHEFQMWWSTFESKPASFNLSVRFDEIVEFACWILQENKRTCEKLDRSSMILNSYCLAGKTLNINVYLRILVPTQSKHGHDGHTRWKTARVGMSVHFAKDRTSSYAWTPRFAAHRTEGVEGGACRARAQTCDEPRLPGCSPEVDLDPCLADSSSPFRNLSYSILQPKAHCAAKHQISTDVSSTFMTHVFFSLYIGQAKHCVVNSVATPWSCE